jgi:hypothetical protein
VIIADHRAIQGGIIILANNGAIGQVILAVSFTSNYEYVMQAHYHRTASAVDCSTSQGSVNLNLSHVHSKYGVHDQNGVIWT